MAVVGQEKGEECNMARNIKPSCKQCRRLGIKLCAKGQRGDGQKCALTRRNYPPGVHGPKGYGRMTDFGLHLQEKQKMKLLYGVLERQLRKVFSEAVKAKSNTSFKLIELLERRLDNVIYRLGLANSRAQARQFVNHGLFLINSKKITIPSYRVKVNDLISIRKEKTKNKGILADNLKNISQQERPGWLNWQTENQTGQIVSLPESKDLEIGIDPRLIVEFYSK